MHREVIRADRPLRLLGKVQEYAWGKVGLASRIAGFLGDVVPERPLAEYWLGTHPKGIATALLPDGTPRSLLDVLPARYSLPFMLKILSINPAFGLSIQSHPDGALARQLHARDPEHYPDPFHKPEVGIAITPVTLLYGIQPIDKLRSTLELYPEIIDVLSAKTRDAFKEYSEVGEGAWGSLGLSIFGDCVTADASSVDVAVRGILQRCGGISEAINSEGVRLVQRLSKTHGTEDAGLLALLVMNIVSLLPGEAIFIGANVPHAYLDGDLVECMACSDNVIRAGLTNKFRDVETLVKNTVYDERSVPQCVGTITQSADYTEFILPVSEFQLGVVRSGVSKFRVDLSRGDALALCIGKQGVIANLENQTRLVLGDGGAAFLPKGLVGCEISTDAAEVFIAHARQN